MMCAGEITSEFPCLIVESYKPLTVTLYLDIFFLRTTSSCCWYGYIFSC